MKNQTVTAALRQSIVKATGYIMQEIVYSDTRKKGTAVGVKVCYAQYSQPIQDAIIEDMESKGYKLAYVRYNNQKYCVPGTRFCFYKK
jgi:site-specific DNA-cytosine methylase